MYEKYKRTMYAIIAYALIMNPVLIQANELLSESEEVQIEETATKIVEDKRLRDKIISIIEDKINHYKVRKTYGVDNLDPSNMQSILDFEKTLKLADNVLQEDLKEVELQKVKDKQLHDESVNCLAMNGYYEARNQSFKDETIVNTIVLNRLYVGFKGAQTVCDVIQQPYQFEWVRSYGMDGPTAKRGFDKKAWNRSLLIAKRLMHTKAPYIDPSNGALYYYNPTIVKKRTGKDWKHAKDLEHVMMSGDHRIMKPSEGDVNYIDTSVPRINPILLNGKTDEERKLILKGK